MAGNEGEREMQQSQRLELGTLGFTANVSTPIPFKVT